MFDDTIFHPFDPACKDPQGAVAAGESVTLSLYPPRDMGYLQAWVTLRYEQWEDQVEAYPIPWLDFHLDIDTFQVEVPIPKDYQGLIWYSFQMDFSTPPYRMESEEYQLTVYAPEDTVPDWFGKGMCYQIFPDRFCRLALPAETGPGDRILHKNWGDPPIYKPEPGRGVTNRDFFGGSLKGVESKLDYLHGLGVETIYFCPIFEALENHRYGTADYEKIDPMLGTLEDFRRLCRQAHKRGIRIILDGVFNHVGWASRYFNATGVYGPGGAAQDPNSPYHDWFLWERWPDEYKSWWGFHTLPDFNKENPEFLEYICGENGIIRTWLRQGADGWRLDVADELPDHMVHAIHQAARAEKPDAIIIGEVWEDGSIKTAYDVRRRHIWGGHCDGLMNYPLRSALIGYLLGGDAVEFRWEMEALHDHYPRWAFYNSMNALGTHDTLRILTFLGVAHDHKNDWDKDQRADYVMTPEEHAKGLERLKLGYALLFAFPGAPTVYYGDEAGMTGFEDPFNRGTFPWGHEDKGLVAFVSKLGRLRREHPALRTGALQFIAAHKGLLAFARSAEEETVIAACNRDEQPRELELPWNAVDLLTGTKFPADATLPGRRAFLFTKR